MVDCRDLCRKLGKASMSFILIPNCGNDLQVNAWNWRPTLLLLRHANLIDEETLERMGIHGAGGQVDAQTCGRVTDFLERQLESMRPGYRIRANLTLADKPAKRTAFVPGVKVEDVDANEVYSATYEWLLLSKDFCRTSGGFRVS